MQKLMLKRKIWGILYITFKSIVCPIGWIGLVMIYFSLFYEEVFNTYMIIGLTFLVLTAFIFIMIRIADKLTDMYDNKILDLKIKINDTVVLITEEMIR